MKNKLQFVQSHLLMQRNTNYSRIFASVWLFLSMVVFLSGCTKDVKDDPSATSSLSASAISETLPSNLAETVPLNPIVEVTFKSATTPAQVAATTITLMQGSNAVAGSVSASGTRVIFTPQVDLMAETTYTATVKTSSHDGSSNHESEHSWRFKTGSHHSDNSGSVVSTLPLNSAKAVTITVQPTVTFRSSLTSAMISSIIFKLKQGKTDVAGTVSFSDKVAIFKPTANLSANTEYTGTVSFGKAKDDDDDDNKTSALCSFSFTTAGGVVADVLAPTILSVLPINNTTAVAVSTKPSVTFSEAMNASTITATTFMLKQGATSIAGAVTYSGTTATFTPTSALVAGALYTGTITTGAKDLAGNAIAANYNWSFTTASVAADVTAPTVLSVLPVNNATAVAVGTKPSATFSEAMNASTITAATFMLKQGATSIAGTVAYSGTTATFTPTSALVAGALYTGTITTGAKDLAGNAIAVNYNWSFTTASVAADVTAPTVISVLPVNNATAVAVGTKPSVTFSEAMNASTITATTFTLKQGATTIPGTVTYSGTTATFTPAVALSGMMPYTATITTGAKDLAGNALAANYTWNFTTVAVVVACGSGTQLFSTNIMPIVSAKCMPCHGASGASAGISLTNYSQVKAIGNRLDNPGMYSKMGVDACSIAIIKAWIAQGSLNN